MPLPAAARRAARSATAASASPMIRYSTSERRYHASSPSSYRTRCLPSVGSYSWTTPAYHWAGRRRGEPAAERGHAAATSSPHCGPPPTLGGPLSRKVEEAHAPHRLLRCRARIPRCEGPGRRCPEVRPRPPYWLPARASLSWAPVRFDPQPMLVPNAERPSPSMPEGCAARTGFGVDLIFLPLAAPTRHASSCSTRSRSSTIGISPQVHDLCALRNRPQVRLASRPTTLGLRSTHGPCAQ